MEDSSGSNQPAWRQQASQVLENLGVEKEEGLAEAEADRRKQKFGPNKLRETERKSRWKILLDQFKSFLVVLLGIAAVVSLLVGQRLEGISILAVLLINGFIGFITELRAVSSMEALREMTEIETRVLRNGEEKKVPAEEVVPGDIVVLHAGDMVPADLRVVESSKLQADESALTGESVPVSKNNEVVEEEVPLAERENMLFKGTFLTRGSARAIAVSTGMDTELGKISASIEEADEEKTPLQRDLDQLGQRLVPLLLVVAAVVVITGLIRGMDPLLMVEEAIALAIATVPEGLPIVATLVLARGMWRMADRNALINNLSSVETLGSTNIICTDKTGTLTENKMTVNNYELEGNSFELTGSGLETEGKFVQGGEVTDEPEDEILRESLQVGVLCNNASFRNKDGNKEISGEPMEVALLVAGLKGGMSRDELLDSMPEEREVSFDPSEKMMATYHGVNGGYKVAVKGAPENVLNSCSSVLTPEGKKEITEEKRESWIKKSEKMANDGLRVLALAKKEVQGPEEEPYKNLTLLGLTGMIDPPRQEVKSAIEEFRNAGMKIVMVTGDHSATAKNVGRSVGLLDSHEVEAVQGSELDAPEKLSSEQKEKFINSPIFARVSPENKLDLIELHQEDGSIVAMTGDGVNDAPALKKADIGIAMGKRGTQVAKEAADMILKDDNLGSIADAVEEGRIIFANIRKFVLYLMSCNISELLAILFASILGLPLPLLPLQILFLNVVNDIFPAFALGACKGSDQIMCRPPREPDEPILTKTHWTEMGFYGTLISVVTVGGFVLAENLLPVGIAEHKLVTISFLTLAFAQLWHVFNMRALRSGVLKNEITENLYVWGALVLCSLLLVASVYTPLLSTALKTAKIGTTGWAIALGMSLVPLLIGQIERGIRGNI